MNETRKPNAMLIELVIVILFFSISAGIILQLFVAAGDRSAQSTVNNAAVLYVEDFAECFAASSLAAEDYFAQDGWTQAEDGYRKEIAKNGRTYALVASGESDARDAGTLDAYTVSVVEKGRTAVTLPVSRYLPKEGTP